MVKKLIKSLIVLAVGIASFILCLIQCIHSFSKEFDGWGTDISIDENYLVALVASLILIVFGIFLLVMVKKKKDYTIGIYTFPIIITILISFYSLGVFFKGVNKQLLKDVDFSTAFANNVSYLCLGLAVIVVLSYFILDLFIYLEKKNKNK